MTGTSRVRLEIRIDLKNKIDMLTPTPGMTELQVQKAQTLSTDCKRLEVVLQQFMTSEGAARNSSLKDNSSFAASTSIGESDQIAFSHTIELLFDDYEHEI